VGICPGPYPSFVVTLAPGMSAGQSGQQIAKTDLGTVSRDGPHFAMFVASALPAAISQQLKCCDLIERNANRPEARAGGELNEIAADNDRGIDPVIRSGVVLQGHAHAFPTRQLQSTQKRFCAGPR
jgi:hypothetical protein